MIKAKKPKTPVGDYDGIRYQHTYVIEWMMNFIAYQMN